jgi:hypothetical protein
MFASILSVAHNLGYPALVLLVMSESSGVPLPGETALITGAAGQPAPVADRARDRFGSRSGDPGR